MYAVGGSTTLGAGVQGKLWYTKLEDWMNERFPCGSAGHSVRVHAASGAGSIAHLGSLIEIAHKLKPRNIDLFMLELGANDMKGLADAPYTEALVYSLVTLQPHAAVMFLTTPSSLEFYRGNRSSYYQDLPESINHLPISLHLNLPLVSIPHALMTSPAKSGNTSSNLHMEGANDPSSPLYRDGKHCGSKCMLYYDGLHLTSAGHSLFASTIAMFFLTMIPFVQRTNLSASPTDVAALAQHPLFPQAKELTETREPVIARSFIESLPKGFELPIGWRFVNERGRFGIAAFGICNSTQNTTATTTTKQADSATMDPCSEPLPVDAGGSTVVLSLLRSYIGLGVAIVEAPSHLMFDFCEVPLTTPQSSCVIDGIFHEKVIPWPVSMPWHVKLHLIPKTTLTNTTMKSSNATVVPSVTKTTKTSANNTTTTTIVNGNNTVSSEVGFFNLSLHLASPALATNLTPTDTLYWGSIWDFQKVLLSPLRELHKVKLLGWRSFP